LKKIPSNYTQLNESKKSDKQCVMKAILLLLFTLFLSPFAEANFNVVYKCFGSSPSFPSAHLELMIDENGKPASNYALGGYAPYFPTWTKAGEVTNPPPISLCHF
jgi:hypothetical protein